MLLQARDGRVTDGAELADPLRSAKNRGKVGMARTPHACNGYHLGLDA